jgi:hypothetical protein
MKQQAPLYFGIIIIVIGAVLLFFAKTFRHDIPAYVDDPASNAALRTFVVEFGSKLKNVPLLAPTSTVAAAMNEYYGPYVAPELLETWKMDPETAPGRIVSSPWPERIDIVAIAKTEGGYIVEGNIIELTSQELEHGGIAASLPVILTVRQRNGTWLVTSFKLAKPEMAY